MTLYSVLISAFSSVLQPQTYTLYCVHRLLWSWHLPFWLAHNKGSQPKEQVSDEALQHCLSTTVIGRNADSQVPSKFLWIRVAAILAKCLGFSDYWFWSRFHRHLLLFVDKLYWMGEEMKGGKWANSILIKILKT